MANEFFKLVSRILHTMWIILKYLTFIFFLPNFRWLISSGDKHIRVFHNVIGFQRTLLDLKQTLEDAVTQGHKERLKQQIQELTTKLKSIGQ